MTASLYHYLIRQHQLPIPGLGTLLIERTPARTDFVNKQILPPAYQYRFDQYFDAPDKDFFSYLALSNNISDFEAIRWFNEWAYELRNQLKTEQPVTISPIGQLIRESTGDIRFLPQHTFENLLQPVAAERVVNPQSVHTVKMGDKEWQSDEAAAWLQEQQEDTRYPWLRYALLLLAAGILVLAWHFYQHGTTMAATGLQQLIR